MRTFEAKRRNCALTWAIACASIAVASCGGRASDVESNSSSLGTVQGVETTEVSEATIDLPDFTASADSQPEPTDPGDGCVSGPDDWVRLCFETRVQGDLGFLERDLDLADGFAGFGLGSYRNLTCQGVVDGVIEAGLPYGGEINPESFGGGTVPQELLDPIFPAGHVLPNWSTAFLVFNLNIEPYTGAGTYELGASWTVRYEDVYEPSNVRLFSVAQQTSGFAVVNSDGSGNLVIEDLVDKSGETLSVFSKWECTDPG